MADGWTLVRKTKHEFWEHLLDDGTLLQTHRSFGSDADEIPMGRFQLILREQLRVSRSDFWAAIRTSAAVDRPSDAIEPAPPAKPAWIVGGLLGYGLSQGAIDALDEEQARTELERLWATPPSEPPDGA